MLYRCFRIVLFQIVIKLDRDFDYENRKFQNCVILDSNKTCNFCGTPIKKFQNCVILDSNKTFALSGCTETTFQNCVILDSNKTCFFSMMFTVKVLELCYFRQ